MVFVLVLLTVAILLAIDYMLRREDVKIRSVGQEKKTPIFLSPEKALLPLTNGSKKLYHHSHTWVLPLDSDKAYVGFDTFVPALFSSEVIVRDMPLVGTHISQGNKIWNVGFGTKRVQQLSPVSGKVVEVNPACKLNIPLPTADIEKSWILKIKTDDFIRDSHNLMQTEQAAIMNNALQDELILTAQLNHYLNDGGAIDPGYIENLSEEEWEGLRQKFFPVQLY